MKKTGRQSLLLPVAPGIGQDAVSDAEEDTTSDSGAEAEPGVGEAFDDKETK